MLILVIIVWVNDYLQHYVNVVLRMYVMYAKNITKVHRTSLESIGGCSSSSRSWAFSWRTTDVCDAWPVRSQSFGGLIPAGRPCLLPIILLGDGGTCV